MKEGEEKMVVDVGFTGIKHVGITGPIAQRPKPTAVNLTGDAMRQHEKIMEYRHEISKLNSDLTRSARRTRSSQASPDSRSSQRRIRRTRETTLRIPNGRTDAHRAGLLLVPRLPGQPFRQGAIFSLLQILHLPPFSIYCIIFVSDREGLGQAHHKNEVRL